MNEYRELHEHLTARLAQLEGPSARNRDQLPAGIAAIERKGDCDGRFGTPCREITSVL